MTHIEIDIDDYLSSADKTELVIQVFKETVKSELLNNKKNNTIQSDSEIQRLIGNISHHIVMKEIQPYIPEFEQMIKDKVKNILTTSDLKYQIFKSKDAWDNQESLAVIYINETVQNHKEILQTRIKETIENYDLSKIIANEISEVFDEMAGNFYKLSELFHNKKDING